MLSDDTKAVLHAMKAAALTRAHAAMEDEETEEWGKLVDIYKDLDHVCRKHWHIEHESKI